MNYFKTFLLFLFLTAFYNNTKASHQGCGILNQVFSVKVNSCVTTSIQEKEFEAFSVYPNPSSTIVHIKGTNKVKIVSLMDISGKNVQAIPHNKLKNELDISSIENGVYFLKIQTINGIITKKLIVAH